MRLIDADKLPVKHGVNVGANYGGLRAIVLRADVDNAPTVDAIPVEWLEKWFTEKYRRAIVWWDCAEDVFKAFVEDWEKENEQNKENTSQAD